MIHHGDCLEVMAGMEPESVDAVVTDPPYGLGFMGKAWDHGAPGVPFWAEMLRVAKPSAYLLAFGGTRTVHRMTVAIEDAGWIIRDMLVWAYASGFPKSKASLKPAWEPIVMARKPGPLRMLAIDECRIPHDAESKEWVERWSGDKDHPVGAFGGHVGAQFGGSPSGRWPANVLLTDPIFDGGWDGVVGGGETGRMPGVYERAPGTVHRAPQPMSWEQQDERMIVAGYGDSGTYSRFFLIPKADRADREPVLRLRCLVCLGFEFVDWPHSEVGCPEGRRANTHPTVKPVDLMRHLVRLVTPTGGTVLDPFAGSGSTLIAAEMEGFNWIGIEKEAEYVAIAEARLNGTQRGLGLPA